MRKLRLPLVVLLVGLMLVVPSIAMAAAASASAGATIGGVALVPAAVTGVVILSTTAIVLSESTDKVEQATHH
ncbi:MAG: hypothetical protein JRI34_07995 [Deltaproteobacteria bacterium]|nr:hypothetical protein [Deltaproteobacteria bacterium]